MQLTVQTRRDLKSILETLDQRLFEIDQRSAQAPDEVAFLNDLRERTAGLLQRH